MHFLRFLPILALFSVIDSLPILMPPRDVTTDGSAVSAVESILSPAFAPLTAYTAGLQSSASGTPVSTSGASASDVTSAPASVLGSAPGTSPSTDNSGGPLPTDIPSVAIPVDLPPSPTPSIPVAPLPTDVPSVSVPVDSPQPTQPLTPSPIVPGSPVSSSPVVNPASGPPASSIQPVYSSIPTPPPACQAKAAAPSSVSADAAAASPTGGTQLNSNPNLTGRTLVKRIAQTDLHQLAQSWQDLCFASGGDTVTNDPCVQLAGIKGINAILADADTCDQQDNADAMVDFAKSAGVTNANALIANAIAYRKHPRNAVNIAGTIPSTPYCQKPPRNQEILGVVNEQLPGLNPYVFGGTTVGMVPFGDPSTCPYGQAPDVNSCSCVPVTV